MRIHLQSQASTHNFPLSRDDWEAACARAPDVSAGHEVSFGDTPEAFADAMREAEALVSQTQALADLLPFAAPHLQMIYCTSAGLDRLAPWERLPQGVPVLNNRGTHAVKAGEYGIMALLMLASRIPACTTAQREQHWGGLHGTSIGGQRATIVGLGALGGSIAVYAKHFGLHVTGVRRTPGDHPGCDRVVTAIDDALDGADYVVLAAPLTHATRGILSRERIRRMKRGAGVVNIGRGGLVDQDALLDALDDGHLGGAVLDVFDPEPVPPGHRLWTTPNLVMTPHTSADDRATYNARSLDIFFDNLRALQAGHPLPNLFDPARGY